MRPPLRLLAPLLAVLSGECNAQTPSRSRVTQSVTKPIFAASCPAAKAGAYSATAVVPKVGATATTATVTVCIVAGAGQPAFAGYQGSVQFDPAAASFDSIAQHGSGMQTANGATPGLIRFAGASPAGMKAGAMLTARLRLKRPGRVPAVTLTVTELNAANGTALGQKLWVQGKAPIRIDARLPNNQVKLGPVAADTAPRLISLDRESVSGSALSSGEVTMVTIRGLNLDPTNNVLQFGPVRITNVRSDSGGKILRFSLPIMQPSGGGAPPMALGPGDYLITVQTPRGTSNTLRFRITP